MRKVYYSWKNIEDRCHNLSERIKRDYPLDSSKNDNTYYDLILCIGRGGMVPSRILAEDLNIHQVEIINCNSYLDVNKQGDITYSNFNYQVLENKRILVVDDVFTTGKTIDFVVKTIQNNVENFELNVATVFYNLDTDNDKAPDFYIDNYRAKEQWIVYPWEMDSEREQHAAVMD